MPRTSGVTQSALARTTLCAIAVLAFVPAMLGVSATALAGGDEAQRAAERRASGAVERP